MAFRDVMVVFAGDRRSEALLKVAAQITQPNAAHLVGLYLIQPITLFGAGVPYSGTETEMRAFESIANERRARAEVKAGEVEKALVKTAGDMGLTQEWRFVEGEIEANAILHARHADIAVLGQADPEHPGEAPHLVESVLLGAGRPILAVPYVGRFDSVGRNVLVAWNATREAARAVNDALPILTRAEKVTVLSVNPPSGAMGGPPWPGADIARHLARHGATAEATSTVSHDLDVGDVVLSRAADFGSDLIVMGGYGHSRQREFILGGATRTLLRHMTVPVFLSH
jgi:nucleotide-binding universal stress UspA family protein